MRQVTRKSLMTVAAATGVIAAAGGYAHADSGAIGSATDSPGVGSGNTVQAPVNVPVNVCGNTIDVIGALNPTFGNSCANKGGGGGGGHRAPGGYGEEDRGHGSHSGHGSRSGHGGNHGGGHAGSHGGHGSQSGGHAGSHGGGHHGSGAHTGSSGGAHAGGHTGGSPGVGSGNHVEAPIDVPVNVCGNSVDVVGLLNPSFGNDCENGGPGGYGDDDHGTPPDRGHETPGKPGHQGPGKPAGHGQSNPSSPEAKPVTPAHVTPARATGAHQAPTHAVAGPAELAHTGSGLPVGLTGAAGAGALLAGALLYRKSRPSA
ncbi:chaplin [Streptomyces sp. NPDC002920]